MAKGSAGKVFLAWMSQAAELQVIAVRPSSRLDQGSA